MTYGRNGRTADVNISKLLSNTDIMTAVKERMQVLCVYQNMSEEEWAEMGLQLLQKTRNDSVKARILELFGKTKGYLKDNNLNVSIFSQYNMLEEKLNNKLTTKQVNINQDKLPNNHKLLKNNEIQE